MAAAAWLLKNTNQEGVKLVENARRRASSMRASSPRISSFGGAGGVFGGVWCFGGRGGGFCGARALEGVQLIS
jgi:uncharacterized membrane protein